MIAELIAQYRSAGVIVDTNILLLFVVGTFDRSLVGRHKRTVTFTPKDYDILLKFLDQFQVWLTTPSVLTEVSNLAAQVGEPYRAGILDYLSKLFPILIERYTESRILASEKSFSTIGLTDSGIIELGRGGHLVLSDDLTLLQFLASEGIGAINFHHLRRSDDE